jgi:hypothetical protein
MSGEWVQGGPVLPIEFSRVSSDRRLTLVIDPVNGEPVVTRFVTSPRTDLSGALCDLRTRENIISKSIGFIDLSRQSENCSVLPTASAAIKNWAKTHAFEAVIWTDLPTNFKDELGVDFSLDHAEEYLRKLPKTVAERAREYIRNAPEETTTPLRRRLHDSGWLES